jgi:hypothetical protein
MRGSVVVYPKTHVCTGHIIMIIYLHSFRRRMGKKPVTSKARLLLSFEIRDSIFFNFPLLNLYPT